MPFQPEKCKPNVLDRFWSHVDTSGECWEWTSVRHRQGYGLFTAYAGCRIKTHRFIDQMLNGPHKPGEFTLHKCDNPSCVRPSHLFRGTNADNMIDMYRKGRRNQKGERNPNSRLTEDQVRVIRKRYQEGEGQSAIARSYDVTNGQVYNIVHGRSWTHIKEDER